MQSHLRWRWRLLGLLAICVYVLLVFVLLRLLVHNLGFAIAFGLTAGLVLGAAWHMFSGTRKRQYWSGLLLVCGLAALAVEFIYFLQEENNAWALAAVLVLMVIYVGLLGVLRRQYWRERRRLGVPRVTQAPRFHKPYLIINPKSGNGRAIKAHIDTLARQQGIQVIVLQKDDDVEVVARRAAEDGADVLGISGGDGSIGAVTKVALEHDLPIVVLPGGTRCHFARDLGLDPRRIADALSGFQGIERRVDAGEINGRIFLNNASFGLYADIVNHPSYRDHKMTISRQVVQSIVNGEKDGYDLQFDLQFQPQQAQSQYQPKSQYQLQLQGSWGLVRMRRAVQVLVGVNRYTTLSVFELGHRERLDEGILHIAVVARLNDAIARRLFKAMSIDRLTRKAQPDTPNRDVLAGVSEIAAETNAQVTATSLPVGDFQQWTADSFTITNSAGTIVAGVDGECEEYKTPLTIRIKPGALRVCVPAEGARNRPKNPFGSFVIRRIWRAVARSGV